MHLSGKRMISKRSGKDAVCNGTTAVGQMAKKDGQAKQSKAMQRKHQLEVQWPLLPLLPLCAPRSLLGPRAHSVPLHSPCSLRSHGSTRRIGRKSSWTAKATGLRKAAQLARARATGSMGSSTLPPSLEVISRDIQSVRRGAQAEDVLREQRGGAVAKGA
eukprot:scaffold2094_cov239-Pinguiococcus_pyrenoidosus.AAC.16